MRTSNRRPRVTKVALAATLLGGLFTPLTAPVAAAPPTFGEFDETPEFSAQNFIAPPGVVRPKYRVWLPLGATEEGELKNQVRALAAIGAGGVETAHQMISDPVSGEVSQGRDGAKVVNVANPYLAEYGWGTERWADRILALEQAGQANDLIVDHGAGPRWVPTGNSVYSMNKPSAQKKLIYGRAVHQAGSSIQDSALPSNWDTPIPSVKTTLCGPAAPGDKNLKVKSIHGLGEGDSLSLGLDTNSQKTVIDRVGATKNLLDDPAIASIASQCTTIADTADSALSRLYPQTLFLDDIAGWQVGARDIQLGNDAVNVGEVTGVGTAVSDPTELADHVTSGQQTIYVNNSDRLVGGDVLVLSGGGTSQEVGEITNGSQGGTHAEKPTKLVAAVDLAPAQSHTIAVEGTGTFATGDTVVLGPDAQDSSMRYYGVVTRIGASDITISAAPESKRPSGSNGTTSFGAGSAIRSLGSGLTLESPLTSPHTAGDSTRSFGSGINVSGILPPHASGATLTHLGTGITLKNGLDSALPSGASVTMKATKKLVKVIAVQCASMDCANTGVVQLDRNSLVDVTDKTSNNGANLTYTFAQGNGNPWQLINFFWTADGQAQATNTSPVSTYNADQLSSDGVTAITNTWDRLFKTHPKIHDLMTDSLDSRGRAAIFQDSLELSSEQKWTPEFMDRFAELRGYDATTVLPMIAGLGRDGTKESPFRMGNDEKARWDYRQTWSDLYVQDYLSAAQSWAESNNLGWRNQAHGDPIDNGYAGMNMAFSDGEGFNYHEKSPEQAFKVVASGANMQGQQIVQTECCADVPELSYKTTAEYNLKEYIYRGMAGGANGLVWHGSPYAGQPTAPIANGPLSYWPGNLQKGGRPHPEAWGPRIPQYNSDGTLVGGEATSGLRQLNDAIARMQLVLRQGEPQFDVAVYYQNLGLIERGGDNPTTRFDSNALDSTLAQKGYTYSYISPEFLNDETRNAAGKLATDYIPGDTLNDGTWFDGRGDFKAVVLNLPKNQLTLRLDASEHFLEAAEKGLPVVINIPTSMQAPDITTPGANSSENKTLQSNFALLLDMASDPARHPGTNVVRVASHDQAGITQALETLDISPAAQHVSHNDATEEAGAIVDVRRQAANADFYWFYNQTSNPVDQTLTLEGKGKPYLLDAQTGEISPIAQYATGNNTVSVQVSLAGRDVSMLILTDTNPTGAEAPPISASIPESSEVDPVVPSDRQVSYIDQIPNLRSGVDGTKTVTLSTGETVTVEFNQDAAVKLSENWSLSVDSWGPEKSRLPGYTQVDEACWSQVGRAYDNPSAPECISVNNTSHDEIGPIEISSQEGVLPGWDELPELRTAAGVGVYETTFDWRPAANDKHSGAFLDLGTITDTFDVWVNGKKLPPLNNVDRSRIDVGPYLVAGENALKVQVATPLFNALIGVPETDIPADTTPQANGLIGPVTLLPYIDAPLASDNSEGGGEPTNMPTPTPAVPENTTPATENPDGSASGSDVHSGQGKNDLANTGTTITIGAALLAALLLTAGILLRVNKRRRSRSDDSVHLSGS